MSNLKKKVEEQVNEIGKLISNEEKAERVVNCISTIVESFNTELIKVSRRQVQLEEKTEEIYNMLSSIEEELIQGMMDDFTGECPYCGENIDFSLLPEDGSDFECPKCHNIIELEMMFDDCDCDCDDCNGDCSHDDEED